jgi:dTDP-4-dehydrorhamnose reductase
VEHHDPDAVAAGHERVLITGAGGRLGSVLAHLLPDADARTHAGFDITRPVSLGYTPDAVLHAAAWASVDRAEADPAGAEAVNVLGTRNVVALGAPVLYVSTDYVFDGTKGAPYVESDPTAPLQVYGRSKLAGEREIGDGWIARVSWLFGETGRSFVTSMLELGAGQDEVHAASDRRGTPTYIGHLAPALVQLLDRPYGTYHVASAGECTWAEFAEALFEDAGVDCRVVPVTTAEAGRKAPRPAYSALVSERSDALHLPHWREGLRECLARLGR